MTNKENCLAKKYKKRGKTSGVFITLSVIFNIIPIYLSIKMVDLLLNKSITKNEIWIYGAIICTCLTLKAVFYGISMWKVHDVAYSCLAEIRLNIVEHLKKMSIAFFQKRKTGELVNIVDHDVEQVELYLAHALPDMLITFTLPVLIFLSIFLSIFLGLDWRLGLALISTVPFALILLVLVKKLCADRIKHFQQSTKKTTEKLVEYILTMPIIKAFSKGETKTKRLLNYMRSNAEWVKKASLILHIPMGIVLTILEGGIVVLIIVASILLKSNQIDSYKFILSVALAGSFTIFFFKMHKIQYANTVFNKATDSIYSIVGVKTGKRDIPYRGLKINTYY